VASKRFFAQALHADWTLFVALSRVRRLIAFVRRPARVVHRDGTTERGWFVRNPTGSRVDRVARRRVSSSRRFARRLFSHFVYGMGRLRTVRFDRWFYRLNSSIGDFVHRVGISKGKKSRSIKWYEMKISIFHSALARARRFDDSVTRGLRNRAERKCVRVARRRAVGERHR